MYQRTRVISLVLALFFIVFHLSSCFSCGRVPLSEEEKMSLVLIGDAITLSAYSPLAAAFLAAPEYTSVKELTDETPSLIGKKDFELLPIRIPFLAEGISDDTALCLLVSETPDLTAAERYECAVEDTEILVTNLLSDTVYYARLIAEEKGEKRAESNTVSFCTPDLVRLLTIEGMKNVRDVGYLRTEDGKQIRQGFLYRGTEFDGLVAFEATEAGMAALRRLCIKTNIDLRNDIVSRTPLYEGVTEYSYPVKQYAEAFDHSKDLYPQAISHFAVLENYPIYTHCTYGKDRTGTLFVILEALLGVSEEDIFRDYAMSDLSYYQPIPDEYHLLVTELSRRGSGDISLGAEKYLLDGGLSYQEISNIRSILLSEDAVFLKKSLKKKTAVKGEILPFTIDVRESGNAVSVTVGNVTPEFTFENGVLLVDTALLSLGEHVGSVRFENGATLSFSFHLNK